MASNGSSRRKLLTAGGILSIVGGIYLISSGVLVAVILLGSASDGWIAIGYLGAMWAWFLLPLLAFLREDAWRFFVDFDPFAFVTIIGGCLGVLGIVAVVGGISAIRRKRFGLSLAGAICALPSVFVGILAVIFVCLGRREFKAKEVDAEVVQ